ncbi:hypothetical protein [Micromonospora sp. NPDC005806]|uniref:hypothetical protein n=1 Tax=Micromonospora sp. NPDC005806 TaxID=3364234 RepID=UPI0036D11821
MFDFPAFCHINEYQNRGYRNLRQMLLLSEPLTLWAPSSVLLGESNVAVDDILWLLDSGRIRIVGRERWLTSESFRNAHPFGPSARWVPRIDDEIKRLLDEDKSRPPRERRVIEAPPEDGYEWADSHMDQHREAIRRLYEVYRRTPRQIPGGTMDTIARNLTKRTIAHSEVAIVVKTMLRDARNHGMAFKISDADIAMHLSRVDLGFMQILADQAGVPSLVRPRGEVQSIAAPMGELALQTIEVLRRLDEFAGGRAPDLRRFLDGSGRADLLKWMRRTCDSLKLIAPAELDGAVLHHLRHQLEHEKFHDSILAAWRRSRLDAAAGVMGAVTSIADAAFGAPSLWAAGGFGAIVFSGTRTILRNLGYIPADFDGPQWPFLYALGAKTTRRRRDRLLQFLKLLGKG